MPDTWEPEHELVTGPSAYSVTPAQSPDETPTAPRVSLCDVQRSDCPDKTLCPPRGLPFAFRVIMCGVRPDGGCAWTDNSLMVSLCDVSTYPTFAVDRCSR